MDSPGGHAYLFENPISILQKRSGNLCSATNPFKGLLDIAICNVQLDFNSVCSNFKTKVIRVFP